MTYIPEKGILSFDYIKKNCIPGETYFVTETGSSPRMYVGFTRSGLLVTDIGYRGLNTRAWREVELMNWRVATGEDLIKFGDRIL